MGTVLWEISYKGDRKAVSDRETKLRCFGSKASSDPMGALELGWPIKVAPK